MNPSNIEDYEKVHSRGKWQRRTAKQHNQNVNCCGGQWPSLHTCSQCRIPLARFSKKPCQRLRCQMRQEARTQIPFTELVTTHEAPQTRQFDVSKIETTVEKPASTTILQWIGLQSLSCHQFQPPQSRLKKKVALRPSLCHFFFPPCPLMTWHKQVPCGPQNITPDKKRMVVAIGCYTVTHCPHSASRKRMKLLSRKQAVTLLFLTLPL